MIAVSVPKEMATSGSGFSFPLPTQEVQGEGGNTAIKVTTESGQPLPGWLKFMPETKSFVANAVPDGAFPIHIVVTVNGVQSTIVISEHDK